MRTLLLSILISLLSTLSTEAKQFAPIEQITIADGLSQNSTTSMMEDSRGYIWIGTFDGLNRYDGSNIRSYANDAESHNLPSNRVRSLCEDSHGNIWIGTDRGVAIFDYDHSTWRRLDQNLTETSKTAIKISYNKKHNEIIVFRNNGEISIYTEDGDIVSSHIIAQQNNQKIILKLLNVAHITDNEYIISTNKGLYIYNIEQQAVRSVPAKSPTNITSITRIDDSTLWLLKSNGEVVSMHYRVHKGKINLMPSSISERLIPLNVDYTSITCDSNGAVWITGNNSVLYIDNPYDISTTKITINGVAAGMIESTTGYAWIYTLDKGVTRYMINGDFFKRLDLESSHHDIQIQRIKPFLEDQIIINSSRGKYKYDTKNHKIIPNDNIRFPYNVVPRQRLSYMDQMGRYWVIASAQYNNSKSWQNVWCLVENGRAIVKGVIPEYKLPTTIIEDEWGGYWSSCGDQLYRIKFENDKLKYENLRERKEFKYINFSRIMALYSDPKDNSIWMGTIANGLFKLTIGQEDEYYIEQYLNDLNDKSSISSNFVSDIYRTKEGVLWVATEQGGICRAIDESGDVITFKRYTKREGLSNNVVKAIVEDNRGDIWLSTNIGISCYNSSSDLFYNYRVKDGLPYEDFEYSSYKSSDGTIYFTSKSGICYFNPEQMVEQESCDLQFEGLRIGNQEILPNQPSKEGNIVLTRRLCDGDEIQLKYTQNFFSIGVSSLHYGNNNSHQLRYRLIPSNEEWNVQPSSNEFITFNGLQQGEYTLEVATSNFNNEWSAPKRLLIKVNPPFWRTAGAYVIYCLIIALLIYVALYFITRDIRLNNDLTIKQIEKQNLEKMSEERKELFANIAHELKTPLTLIHAPIDFLNNESDLSSDNRDKLRLVQRQIRKMTQLIDFTINFQSDNTEIYQPQHTVFDFSLFMKDVVDEFTFLAKYSQKILNVDINLDKRYVYADYGMIEKIVYNIINNAFKYTNAKDLIAITCSEEDKGNNLIIKVSDSGVGIPAESIPHIFERYYHGENPTRFSSTGIGLHFSQYLAELHSGEITVTSEVGEGSIFTLRLPIITDQRPEVSEEVEENADSTAEPTTKVVLDDFEVITDNNMGTKDGGTLHDVRIFIVEDDPEVRYMLTNILSPLYKIKTFNNGVECLTGLEEEWPDIILSDIMMPEMDGWTLCQRVKEDIKTSHIPIILLTAVASSVENRMKGLEYGADAYISKPFYSKHLLKCINSLLQNRETLKKRFQANLPTSFTAEEQHDRRRDYDFIQKLYNLIDKNIMDDVPYESYARDMGVSRSLFYNKIKAITDMTPAELLRDYRLARAAELLAQAKYSITDVYTMTGFKSRSTFSKLFKSKYGVSPKDYNK